MEESKNDQTLLTASQACKRIGATPAQLKNWDKHGVLKVQRTGEAVANNRKLYTEEDVQRARDILVLKELGLTLGQIQEILDAPEKTKASLFASYGDQLRERFHSLKQQIMLSSAAEALGFEKLEEDANALGDRGLLGEAYAQDQNLQQVIWWLKSHTDRSVEQFAAELVEVADGFLHLEEHASWDETQLQIARFCDAWGSRLGWPTVGQMLELSISFSENDDLIAETDRILGANASVSIAQAFRLGWISTAVECLDNIAICYYIESLADESIAVARKTAEVLVAFACEIVARSYLANQGIPNWSNQVTHVIEAAFEAIPDAALDEKTERFLELEDFTTVDGSSLETFKKLAIAYANSGLDRWYKHGGRDELEQRRNEWIDLQEDEWLAERAAGTGNVRPETEGEETVSYEDGGARCALDPSFIEWLQSRYAELLADPPEARFATEEEMQLEEKRNRQLIEDASDMHAANS